MIGESFHHGIPQHLFITGDFASLLTEQEQCGPCSLSMIYGVVRSNTPMKAERYSHACRV